MTTEVCTENAISFDDLVAKEEKANKPKRGVWMAMIDGLAPLMIQQPSTMQDNKPLCLKD